MCMHARMRGLVWSGDGTYVRRRRPWPARGKICACAFLVMYVIHLIIIRLFFYVHLYTSQVGLSVSENLRISKVSLSIYIHM